MTPNHPRVVTRGRPRPPEAITQVISRVIHVLVYAPVAERKAWIDRELMVDTTIQIAHDVGDVVRALVEDSRSRPQFLVIDLDALSAGELFHLHEIRERGWCGEIIALGQVPPSLRSSLQIGRVLRSQTDNALAGELAKYRCATEERTMPLPIFPESLDHKTFG